MIRTLLWLQWRLVVNGMRSRGRGGLDEASRWIRIVLPVLAAAVLVPAVLVMAALGAFAGWALVSLPEGGTVVPVAVAIAASAVAVWSLVRPFLPDLRGGIEHHPLLRLLPVPPALLHRLQLLWLLLDVPTSWCCRGSCCSPRASWPPAGRVRRCWRRSARWSSSFHRRPGGLATDLVQLLFRSRRRAEAVTLVFFVVLSMAGIVPYALQPRHGKVADGRRPAAVHRSQRPEGPMFASAWLAIPSVACAAAVDDGAAGRPVASLAATAAMLPWMAVLYGLSLLTSRRLLETPAVSSAGLVRRAGRQGWDLPGLAPATAAVARVQLRGFLRTVRGRMVLVSPLVIVGMLALLLGSGRHQGPLALLGNPAYLAAFAFWSALSNLSTTLGCNQLTLLGPGLLVELLQPLDAATLLRGRAAAVGMVFLLQEVVILALLAAFFRGAPVALWPGLLLAGLAVLVSLLPLFALLSAVFPKTVDLNTMRRGGTVSAAAALINMLAIPFSSLPMLVAGWLALGYLHHAWMFPVLAGAWLAAMLGLWRLLVPSLARLVDSRRETLALTAAGR